MKGEYVMRTGKTDNKNPLLSRAVGRRKRDDRDSKDTIKKMNCSDGDCKGIKRSSRRFHLTGLSELFVFWGVLASSLLLCVHSMHISSFLTSSSSLIDSSDKPDILAHYPAKSISSAVAPPRRPSSTSSQCIIVDAEEGDSTKCWCPKGMVLCNWREVESVTPADSWLKILCTNGDAGLNGTFVYVDYALDVKCSVNATRENPMFEYVKGIGEGVHIETNDVNKVAQTCQGRNFYLCKEVEDDAVDCKMTEWGKWEQRCVNNVQKRFRSILKSGEHGGRECEWNGVAPTSYTIVDVRECPEHIPDDKRKWTAAARGELINE